MACVDDTLTAAAAILQNLAREAPSSGSPSFDFNFSPHSTNGVDTKIPKLPGDPSLAKVAFENELEALVRRIHRLEIQTVQQQNHTATHAHKRRKPSNDAAPEVVEESDLEESDEDEDGSASRLVREEDISILRNHVQKQAEEISFQKDIISQVREELQQQEEQTRRALTKVENEDVVLLERELRKHQQANEAFQKALREIGGIITQVANGDLSMKVQIHPLEMDPEIATFKRTINTMMDQLQVFGSEVSRVAREVGTEGILGGQAQITGVHGIWKELTENVNIMAKNLTDQVREIAVVTTAVAHGDLSQKIESRAQGEILELQQTINTMVDQLRTDRKSVV